MSSTLDLTFIREMMGHDENVVTKFLTIFKGQCPLQLQELKQHYRNEDWQALSNVAHSLKTQLRYLSIETLAEQVYAIETLADEPPCTGDRRRQLGELIQSFDTALTQLLQDITLPS
jgi:HPt (histidine-containing phosphotransfer) domain-containing protein